MLASVVRVESARVSDAVRYCRRSGLGPRARAYFWPYGIASFVGGGLGGALLLGTSDRTFVKLIPWLLLFAAALFTLSADPASPE